MSRSTVKKQTAKKGGKNANAQATLKRKSASSAKSASKPAPKVKNGKKAKVAKVAKVKKPARKARKVTNVKRSALSDEDESLFDDDMGESSDSSVMEDEPISKAAKKTQDGQRVRRKYTKRDYRSCFSTFFELMKDVPHPSSLQIDLASSMKLRRQGRLLELDRMAANSDDEDDQKQLFDECLDLYSDSEESITSTETSDCSHSADQTREMSQVTTGLETVDRIICQARQTDDGGEQLFRNESNGLSMNEPVQIPKLESLKRTAESSRKRQCRRHSTTRQNIKTKSTKAPSLDLKFDEFLTIDTSDDTCSMPTSPSMVFPYRFNSDKLNLSLVDDGDAEVCVPRSKAINKRAFIYGNPEAMVVNSAVPATDYMI